ADASAAAAPTRPPAAAPPPAESREGPVVRPQGPPAPRPAPPRALRGGGRRVPRLAAGRDSVATSGWVSATGCRFVTGSVIGSASGTGSRCTVSSGSGSAGGSNTTAGGAKSPPRGVHGGG